jgi:hypothetical protein
MRHQERLVLRPLPQRGFDVADVRPPLDADEIRDEIERDAPEAIRLALGAPLFTTGWPL